MSARPDPSRRPLPPPLRMPKPGFGRSTPPAIFPPIMGLFGLGLCWRIAASVFGVTGAFADFILGAVTLLFAFALIAWLAKPLRRPGAVLEELRVLPGRAGMAAASLSLMLLATSLAPFAPDTARVLGILAFGTHLVLIGLILHVFRISPPEVRVVTPVMHLVFVGLILGGPAALALGVPHVAKVLLWAMVIPASVIWVASLRQMIARLPPAPLRPLLVIHLAPASLFAIVAHGAGLTVLSYGFTVLAGLIFAALLVSVRWLSETGFTPLWGAMTFPPVAFSTALMLVSQGAGLVGMVGGGVLVFCTLFIPYVAFRVLKLWAGGTLAAKTNAAEA